MPLYEFTCQSCSHRFEELRSMSDTTSPPCPACASSKTEKAVTGCQVRTGGGMPDFRGMGGTGSSGCSPASGSFS